MAIAKEIKKSVKVASVVPNEAGGFFRGWKPDKSVPLIQTALILAQFVGFVFYAGQLSSEVKNDTDQIHVLQISVSALQGQSAAIARLEEQVKGLTTTIGEIKEVVLTLQGVRFPKVR